MICSEWVIVRPRVLPTLDGLSFIILILQVNLNLSMIFEKSTYAYAWLDFGKMGASRILPHKSRRVALPSLYFCCCLEFML